MFYSYNLESSSAEGESARRRDSRSYSLLPSLSSQDSAQAISEKKTVTQITPSIWVTAAAPSHPSVVTQEMRAANSNDCSATSARLDLLSSELLLYSSLIPPQGSSSFTTLPRCLPIPCSFISTSTGLWNICWKESTILNKQACVFSFSSFSCKYSHVIQKEEKNWKRLGFLSQWGNAEPLLLGIQT